jgi:maltose alpha-D-glucosyltransferase/alpha-amylase
MKRTLTLRKRHPAFGRGSLQFLHPENRKILAFVRQADSERILVVANLSRFHQPAHLDLTAYKNCIPVELMGRTEFPMISEKPYVLTLGPHMTLWFSLEPARSALDSVERRTPEMLAIPDNWEDLFQGEMRGQTESYLGSFLRRQAWFGGKERPYKSLQIQDAIAVPARETRVLLLILLVEYMEGDPDRYLLPVGLASGPAAEHLEQVSREEVIARVRTEPGGRSDVLYDASTNKEFCRTLLEAMVRRRSCDGLQGELRATGSPGLRSAAVNRKSPEGSSLSSVLHSSRGIIFSDKYFLKLFRRLEPGGNPELEVGHFLTARGFANVPFVLGSLEYRRHNGEEIAVGILSEFKANTQDAWAYTLDLLSRYFDRARTAPPDARLEFPSGKSQLDVAQAEIPEPVIAFIGTYAELARLLGQRSAEMHLALAADSKEPDFAPEPITPFYQRALFQSMRNLAMRTFYQLGRAADRLPEGVQPQVAKLISLQAEVLKRLRTILAAPLHGKRIRCHGDFHLEEVLFTGKDFIFIDFEGQADRPAGERRIKRSPLRDVVGMIRSFDYISTMALFRQIELGALQEQDLPTLEPWSRSWYRWVSSIYLKSYIKSVGESGLLPLGRNQLAVLMEVHLIEKLLQEACYEMEKRPHLLRIPLHALIELLSH